MFYIQFSCVLNIAKLQADITYNQSKQETLLLSSTINHIELEQQNINLDDQNKESNLNDEDVEVNDEEIEEKKDSDKDIGNNIKVQFQNQLGQLLKMKIVNLNLT